MLEISLRQLETFVVTAECASFTRAADKLHLTQSTVSTHIQTGRRVYAAAKEILNRCEALESMRESSDAATLSIATSTVPAQQLLPKLMSGFLKRNNAARFALRRGDSDAVRTMLEKGEVRIGLMGAQPDSRRFTSYPVAQDMLVMISENSPRFRMLKQQGATGIQLINEPMIAREESSGTQQSVEAYFTSCGVDTSALRIVARMDNPEAIKAGVAQGMGVSVISYLAAQEEVVSGKVLSFDLDRKKAFRTIYIAWRKDTALTAIEQRFVNYVRMEAPKIAQ